jgi:phage portal protein BeeE
VNPGCRGACHRARIRATRWLIRATLAEPQFGEAIRVTIDTDRIDALAADRAALWDRVSNAAFLTLNEKREAVGYGPVAGGDRWG